MVDLDAILAERPRPDGLLVTQLDDFGRQYTAWLADRPAEDARAVIKRLLHPEVVGTLNMWDVHGLVVALEALEERYPAFDNWNRYFHQLFDAIKLRVPHAAGR